MISLTDSNFEQILDSRREADIILMLTATAPQVGCSLCIEMAPDFQSVANSWFSDHANGLSNEVEGAGLFFAKVDFNQHTKKVFQYFGLNNVPAFFVFRAGGERASEYEQVTVTSEPGGNHLQFLADRFKKVVQIPDFVVYEPINWGSTLITTVVVGGTTFILKKYTASAIRILTFRPLWGAAVSFLIITLIAGAMFVRIRGSQFSGASRDGTAIIYFLEGQLSNQYAIETQIITVLYSVLGSSLIGLICVVPGIQKWYSSKNQSTKGALIQLTLVVFLSVTIFVFYSALLAVFALKSHGYPFRLFKNPFK